MHRAVPRVAPPSHRLEHSESLVEAVRDFGDPDRTRPCRGQFNRQWDSVEALTDLDDQRPNFLVQDEGGVGGRGSSDEERDRGDLGHFGERHVGREQVLGSGRQRVHRPESLAGHGQRFPAGGHDGNGGRLTQDPRHQLGHGLDQVLAIVKHQQAVPGAQQIDDGIVDRTRLPQVDVDGRGKRCRGGVRIDDSDELHDVDSVLESATNRAGQLHRQRGLPHAPGADQRDQPVVGDHHGELRQQRLATDQRLQTDADRRSRGHGGRCDPGPTLLHLLHGRHEFVAFAMHRPDDQLLATVVTDSLADRFDPSGQRRLTHESVTPDRVEQLLFAHHRAAVLDEIGEHVEHLRLDPDLLAAPSEDDAVQVQLAVGESNHPVDRSLRRWSGFRCGPATGTIVWHSDQRAS